MLASKLCIHAATIAEKLPKQFFAGLLATSQPAREFDWVNSVFFHDLEWSRKATIVSCTQPSPPAPLPKREGSRAREHSRRRYQWHFVDRRYILHRPYIHVAGSVPRPG